MQSEQAQRERQIQQKHSYKIVGHEGFDLHMRRSDGLERTISVAVFQRADGQWFCFEPTYDATDGGGIHKLKTISEHWEFDVVIHDNIFLNYLKPAKNSSI